MLQKNGWAMRWPFFFRQRSPMRNAKLRLADGFTSPSFAKVWYAIAGRFIFMQRLNTDVAKERLGDALAVLFS